jgi:hypothetical protein
LVTGYRDDEVVVGGREMGSENVKVEPLPTSLRTPMRPP